VVKASGAAGSEVAGSAEEVGPVAVVMANRSHCSLAPLALPSHSPETRMAAASSNLRPPRQLRKPQCSEAATWVAQEGEEEEEEEGEEDDEEQEDEEQEEEQQDEEQEEEQPPCSSP
jgi:hypothetical protein